MSMRIKRISSHRVRYVIGVVGIIGNQRNVRRSVIAVEIRLLSRNRTRLEIAVGVDDRRGVRG